VIVGLSYLPCFVWLSVVLVNVELGGKPQKNAGASEDWAARTNPLMVSALRPWIRALARIHPVTFQGIENVPRGPAILIGNHGTLGYESLLFFERVLAECGRLPVGLADRFFFKIPGVRDVLVRLGGARGTIANGLRALAEGQLLVIYPGGARETLKRESDKYRLLWDKSFGFARLALAAGVPIIPFAAAGVDDTFRVVAHVPWSGRMLMGHGKYDLPLVWGQHGPLPKPVPFTFRFGAPIAPPDGVSADDDEGVRALHRDAWTRTETLLRDLVAEWTMTNLARRATR
jgi:1-acyl-sn-glycerol-3-phosphate acyltransferase